MHRSIIGLALAVALAGQARAQAADAVSFDVTLGPAGGWGGRRHYFHEGLGAAEVTIGMRPAGVTTAMGALTVGATGAIGHGDKCALEMQTSTVCRPQFPEIAHIGLLGGLERAVSVATLRALAGPAFFGGDGPSGLGAHAQIDAAAGFTHLAFVVAARGSVVVRFTGETLELASLGLGLRIR